LQIFLTKSTLSTRRASTFSARADDRDRGHGGLGGSGGGKMVPLPARLYYGQGGGHEGILECGLSTAEVSRFGPSRRRCQNFEGKEGEPQKISAEPPEVPPPTCTTGGTGWGHATL